MKNRFFVGFFGLSLLLMYIGLANADEYKNVRRLAVIDDSLTEGGMANLWGWENPNNDSLFALCTNHTGTYDNRGDCGMLIYNTTDPENPYIRAKIKTGEDSRFDDVSDWGNYMIASQQVSNDTGDFPTDEWLYVEDLTSMNTTFDDSIDIHDTLNIDNVHTLNIGDDGMLYLCENKDEVAMYDLTSYNGANLNSCFRGTWVRPTFSISPAEKVTPHRVWGLGDSLYCAMTRGGVYIADIKDTTINNEERRIFENIKQIIYDGRRGHVGDTSEDSLEYWPVRTAHSVWVPSSRDYVYVNDEVSFWTERWDTTIEHKGKAACFRAFELDDIEDDSGTFVLDLVDAYDMYYDTEDSIHLGLASASLINTYMPDSTFLTPAIRDDDDGNVYKYMKSEAHHLHGWQNNFLFISWYNKGLRVLDISDPTDIIEAGYYDPEDFPDTLSDGRIIIRGGYYGVYAGSPDSVIYCSGDGGLSLFKFGLGGTIEQDEVWSDYVYISDDLTIADTVKVTIYYGTTVKFSPGCRLTVNGELKAGATSDGQTPPSPSPIIFTSAKSSPSAGDWEGIYLADDAIITMRKCKVEYAQEGLEIRDVDSCYVYNTEISNCSQKGVATVINTWGTTFLDSLSIHDNGDYGIVAGGTGNLKIHRSQIYNHDYDGIFGMERAEIKNCKIYDNDRYGIRYRSPGDTLIIEGNDIYFTGNNSGTQWGIYVYRFSSQGAKCFPYIKDNLVEGYEQGGIKVTDCEDGTSSSGTRIVGENHVKNNDNYGIYLFKTDAYVVGDTCPDFASADSNGTYGVFADSCQPTIEYFRLWDNTRNFGYEAAFHNPPPVVIQPLNSFHTKPGFGFPAYYDVYIVKGNLQCEDVYWGESTPDTTDFYGTLDYTPYDSLEKCGSYTSGRWSADMYLPYVYELNQIQ